MNDNRLEEKKNCDSYNHKHNNDTLTHNNNTYLIHLINFDENFFLFQTYARKWYCVYQRLIFSSVSVSLFFSKCQPILQSSILI